MEKMFEYIDTDIINEELEFSLDNLIDDLKESLEESNLLLDEASLLNRGKYTDIIFNGKFEDDVWAMKNDLQDKNSYFDFGQLQGLKNNYESILLIKCWVASTILDLAFDDGMNIVYRHVSTMAAKFSAVIQFILETNNFDLNYLDRSKGSKLISYFNSKITSSTSKSHILWIKEYLLFIMDKVDENTEGIIIKYMKQLEIQGKGYIKVSNPRKLPRSKDILLFSIYLESFFNDNKMNSELKLYYMPILIWWKITTIIPMRPSEFAKKLKRDCLFEKDGHYYLKIDRVKKKANLQRRGLPVLNRVKITIEIYTLIQEYIDMTEQYGYTQTLISYRALRKIRHSLFQSNRELKRWNKSSVKMHEDAFNAEILFDLLQDFYEVVIKDIYNDKRILEYIHPGDTRHLAFTSMMLQGYSPVEIAIIGGHRRLSTLENYTCSMQSYIDSEVISMIRNNISIENKNYKKLMDIVFKMPKECPIPLSKCIETRIGEEDIGYCTANFKINKIPCEDELCCFCSKWWCEPTEYNFLCIEKAFKEKLNEKNNKLKRDIEFMLSLFKEVGLNVINGRLCLDNKVAEGIKRASLELKSNTQEIIHLKYQMIDPCSDTFRLLTDIEELLPTKEVVKIIDRKIKDINKEREERIVNNRGE